MAENSKIQWCHHTFNPWRGCTKVSPGCQHCYAEKGSNRNPAVLGVWGKQGTRVIARDPYWKDALKWEHWARTGVCHACRGVGQAGWRAGACEVCEGARYVKPYRARVFCASLADVFEGPETMPPEAVGPVTQARGRLLALIQATPHLDWLLLTKRPERWGGVLHKVVCETNGGGELVASAWLEGEAPYNVWLGVSVEDQERADERIPHLLDIPARVRFLSCEPLLGPLDLTRLRPPGATWLDCLRGREHIGRGVAAGGQRVDWVIVGGESGPRARPFAVEWCGDLVRQCSAAGVACFVKQLGAAPTREGRLIQIGGRKGDELDDWPERLRVRQFPTPGT